tara:strand:+ start:1519 stop:2397 length:879 start_codon:yes stop_codon:yes gene_type:complete
MINLRNIYEKIIYRSYSLIYKKGFLKSSIFAKYFLSQTLFFFYRNKYLYISKLLNLKIFNQTFFPNQNCFIGFNQIYKVYEAKLIFFSKILTIGPASDYEKEIAKHNPDLVVLTKITTESIKSNLPHIYILNNSWTEKNISLIKEVRISKKRSIIFTPYGRHQTRKYPDYLELFSSINLGVSPMGLQRLLLILPHIIKFNYLIIRGYNFGISDKPYLSWYPSLIKENWGSINKGLFLSYMRHSLPYNINLTRQIISYFYQKENVKLDCNDLLEVIKKPLYQIIDEFKIQTKH